MLQLRQAQMQSLHDAAVRSFENGMLSHLQAFAPALIKTIPESQTRTMIRFGIARASRYGFDLRGPVRLYLEMMLLLGSCFDTDPQYPWASDVLFDKVARPQLDRAQQLYARLISYRERVNGPDDAYLLQALRVIERSAMVWRPPPGPVLAETMTSTLSLLYPQKAQYISNGRLASLVALGKEAAEKYQLPAAHGAPLCSVLIFMFGHGCCDDPMLPWLTRTLKDQRSVSDQDRVTRLQKRALIWLHHAISHFEQKTSHAI